MRGETGVLEVAPAAETSDDALSASETSVTLLPLRFLGMGLFIAWLSCTHISLIFPGPDANLLLVRRGFDIGMRLGDISTFVVFALVARRIGVLSDHRIALWASVGLCAGGTALEGLVLLPSQAPYLLVVAVAALTAIGGAFLFCLWGQIYSRMGKTQVITYGSLSCIAAFAVSALIGTVREPFAIVFVSLLPALSLVCAVGSLRLLPPEPPADDAQRYPMPWKLFVIMAIGALISGTSGVFMTNTAYMGSIHRISATGIFGVLTLVVMRRSRRTQDARTLAIVTVPLAIASLCLVPFAEGEFAYLVSLLAKLAFVFFAFFILLVVSRIVHRFDVPSLQIFALTRFFTELPLLIGVLSQHVLTDTGFVGNTTVRVAMSLGGIVLVLLCILIWKSEKSVNDDWGAAGVTIEGSVHTPTEAERMARRSDELAARFDLTRREQEIVLLVAEGKTRAQIESELFLSDNTVKTHIRHAYAKLGVHSKEQVKDLFDEAR